MMNYKAGFLGLVLTAGVWVSPASALDLEQQVQACAVCHGQQGVAPSDAWPNLAGQKQGYLVDQLKAYREGRRQNPIMAAAVAELKDDQLQALATYYAEQPAVEFQPLSNNTRGEHVRARCISCHGREGITVNPEWPNLAGQNAGYLQQQLQSYKSGEREHTLMQVIARELSAEEIKAVSEYYSGR